MEQTPTNKPNDQKPEFVPIHDTWYDALLKKLPAGWKPDAKMFMYAGLGLLIFLGLIASSATQNQQPQTTTRPTTSSLPTLPPNIDDENPVSLKRFTDTIHDVSFNHPGLSDQCCFIIGPTHGNNNSIGNLSDPKSVRRGSDAPFNGLSLYIIELEGGSPNEFIQKEAKNLKEQYAKINGHEPKNASWQTLTVASQSAVLLKNYNSLTVNRYYITLPENKKILYIGASEESLGSFNSTLNTILSSLSFATYGAQLDPQ